MFDQVLIRPEFAGRLPAEHLRVITATGVLSLADSDGLPDHNSASDHFPVAFTLS